MAPVALHLVAVLLLTLTNSAALCGSPRGQKPRPLATAIPGRDHFRGCLRMADAGGARPFQSSGHYRRRRCCYNAGVTAPLKLPRRGVSSLSSSWLPGTISTRAAGSRNAPRGAFLPRLIPGSLGVSNDSRGCGSSKVGRRVERPSNQSRGWSQQRLRNRGGAGLLSSSSLRESHQLMAGGPGSAVARGSTSRTRLAATPGGTDAEKAGSADIDLNEVTAAEENTRGSAAAAAEARSDDAKGWQGWVDGMVTKFKEGFPEPAEAKKILPLGLMLFFILFDYTILRDTKDVLVVTAPNSGAEVIPFLKTYVNLPGAVAFTVLYSKLCNSAEQRQVFYTVMGFFLSFFALFGAFLYPNRDVLSTAALADAMQAFLPQGLSALSSIVRNWTFSAFYLMSELWGSVIVSVLFWGFANDIVSVSEAKRFYPLFGLGANVALVFSGQYVRLVSSVRQSLPPDVDKWGVSLQLLMGAVVVGGIVVAGCYEWMQQNVITDPECVDANRAADMKETTSLTLKESAVFLAGNAYLRDVAILVIAYGTSINIVEVTWKAKLKMAYPDPNDYSAFMGNFSTTTGLVTLGMMLLGSQVFKNYGWGSAAKATPVVLLVTGVAFFSLSLFGDAAPVQAMLGALSTSPLMLAVLAGGAQNVLSKSCKYSLFDPCKEMAYIPLSPEEKRKGKAAVDVIGNPLGKSTGSFVQQGLFLATGSLQASTPYLGGVLLVVITTWLFAADSLSKKFEEAMVLAEAAVTDKVPTATATTGEEFLVVTGEEDQEAGAGAATNSAAVTLNTVTKTGDRAGA